jgi:lipoprotein NlpI
MKTPGDFLNAGVEKWSQRDFDGAIVYLSHAIELKPDFAEAFNHRGSAKYSKKDYGGAVSDHTHAIRLKPDFAAAYVGRGLAKGPREDVDGAVRDFDRAIELRPDYAEAFSCRAFVKRFTKNYDGAIADYDRVLHLKPDSADAYFRRASTKKAKKDLSGALADFDEGIMRSPGTRYARFYRHTILIRLGRGPESDLAQQVPSWTEGWAKTIGQFLIGQITKDDFQKQAAAKDSAGTTKRRTCEMNYYAGVLDLLGGRAEAARMEFEACLEMGVTGCIEFILARAELDSLGQETPPCP